MHDEQELKIKLREISYVGFFQKIFISPPSCLNKLHCEGKRKGVSSIYIQL